MKFKYLKLAFMVVMIFFAASLNKVFANNQNTPYKLVSQADIQQKITQINDKQNLSVEIKNRLLAAYNESTDNLKEIQAQETQAESFKQAMNKLPMEAKQLTRQIATAENNLKNRKQEKLGLIPTDELEQRLISEKTSLSDLDAEVSRLDAQINQQLTRPQQIREKISEIKSKQAISQQEQQEVAGKHGNNLAENEARQLLLDTRIRLFNTTLKTLELENISGPLRLQNHKDLLHLQNLKRELLSFQIADLDNFLLDRRQQEIEKQQAELQQAEKEAEGKSPLILAATKENIQFNHILQDVNNKMEQFQVQKNELDVRYQELEKDFQSAQQKINLAGMSPALGNLLREQRRNLPQRKQYSELNENIQNEIAQASLETFKLEEAKKKLSDVGQAMLTRMSLQLPADISDAEKLKTRTELRILLNDQKDIVSRLYMVYAEYSHILGDVDFSLQQMLNSSDKFSEYLDQRLLWVPSAPIIDKYYLDEILNSALWFVSSENWLNVETKFQDSIENHPVIVMLGLIFVIVHWRFIGKIKELLQNILSKNSVSKQHLFSFGETVQAFAYLWVLSLNGPLLMIWLCGVLILGSKMEFFSHAFAKGLFSAAISLSIIQFFFRVFKPEGFAEVMFQWPRHITYLLYSQFKWSRYVVVPCIFMTSMTGSDVFSEHSLALGRTALILMMLAMAYMFHRFSHPATGLGKVFYRQHPGWITSLRYLWYLIALIAPLVIIGFAVAGYYQSALELQQKLIFSLRLIFITVLFHELAQGWLAISKHQLSLQNARQKRKQSELPVSEPLEDSYPIETSLFDLSQLSKQSEKLLTTITAVIIVVGCWMIWRDILSAFAVFDQIPLWQHILITDGKETLQPITLTNLLLSVMYAGVTSVLVANFPALVDLLLIGKYQMSTGSRYALIQLSRYVLIAIAFLIIANELGGAWSQVQWLVAALSVGLGFGLQEIFANMVSGIILLFERPIRVGDTVTIGDVTGRVVRIQMRATHIVDYDRKELVVPNKIFITDRLVNWTLSDTVTRIVVPVGVAYGTDIDQVEALFREAIKQTPLVLQEPLPEVIFNGFGESSLDFSIQVFVHELKDRIAVRHSLHKNIYDILHTNHIEIPFPQRDVYIRATQAS